MSSVYLAGGFGSGWQQKVIGALKGRLEILDPSEHGLEDVASYTAWDLNAIRRCSVLLAYMEDANPGGYALALEVGFAHALGKTVVLVDDLSPQRGKYFEMVRAVATIRCEDLETACSHVCSLVKVNSLA